MTKSSFSGGCACGAVRYESSAQPKFELHCCCRQCQRATGGGHASSFALSIDAVTITGDMKFFDQTADSGNTVSRGFCPDCGSPMMNINSSCPEMRYIHAATLDDPSIFKPTMVVFHRTVQPWDLIDPDIL